MKKNHDLKCLTSDELILCATDYIQSKHGQYNGVIIERDYGIEDILGDERKVQISGNIDRIFYEIIKECARRKGDSESKVIGRLIIFGFLRVKEKGWD